MRIALMSTSAITVPPKTYGGTELFIYELSKMLTKRGHEVTVYATGDSRPAARLRSRFPEAVWPPNPHVELRHVAHAWSDIASHVPPFDVVHCNQVEALAFASTQGLPTLLTLHGDRNEAIVEFCSDYSEVELVAISQRQADLVPELAPRHVVHHGLDPSLYPFGEGNGGYCAFLGRLAPEKGPHLAIDAARLAHVPLRIAGMPHWVNEKFFDDEIEPRTDAAGTLVDYLGEVSHEPKVDLLRHAKALLFPIEWEEPFGLVMIESMLCGTPVIAFPRGSVPEVVEDGVTGFVVKDVREMAQRLRDIGTFDRARCRRRAEERWSSMRMARDYERIYAEMLAARAHGGRARQTPVTHHHPQPVVFEHVVAASRSSETQEIAVGPGGLFTPFFRTA